MLSNVYVAVFTQNLPLFQKLEESIRVLGIPVSQFSYGDRMETLERWTGGSQLIAIFDGAHQTEACLRWIKWLSEDSPQAVCVWLDSELKQQRVAEAMRAGARDLLVGEFQPADVEELVKRLAFHRVEKLGSTHVVAVMGAAGGAGVSTLVTNLAVEIARHENVSVGVLDLDPFVSGVGLLLNIRPDATLFDLWQRGGDLDASVIKRIAVRHSTGVSLIASQGWAGDQLPIPEQLVRRVILLMRPLFPYLLIDMPRSVCPVTPMVFDTTEAILLVGQYSMTAAAGLRSMRQSLEAIEYPKHRILPVTNSVSQPAVLSRKQWVQLMAREPFAAIPYDPDPVNQAAAAGTSLSEASARATVTRSVQNLAQSLCGFLNRKPESQPREPAVAANPPRRVAALSR